MGVFWKKSMVIFVSWLGLVYLVKLVESGPLNLHGPSGEVANNSLAEFDSSASKGCRYKAAFYSNAEEVSTDEPCLACQCKGTVVVCKLRICPEIPVPPPPGCIVVHKAKSCCSQLICHGHGHGQEIAKKISREQRFPLSVSNETLLASVSNESKESGFCVLDGTVYAEGSAMRSSTLCQYCFCIRGEMKCSSPQCVIPLKGCKPRFRSYACCPTNYDCGQSNETAILQTMPSSTQVPQFLKGCLVGGQFVPEGEPVLPVQISGFSNDSAVSGGSSPNVCTTCFCMGGVVHCQPLECDQPIDGCVPIKEDGHCCPDRYDCSKPQPLITSTTARTVATSSSTSATSLLVSLFSETIPTTTSSELSSNEMEGEIVTSTSEVSTTQLSESEPVTVAVVEGNDDEPEYEQTTKIANDDSFERVATVMAGSSEETSSLPPSQVLTKRVSATTIGGFKNRSDLGSREERRSKDGDELSLRQSTEDDEHEEFMYPVFETTISNAIEDLGATTLYDVLSYNPTTDAETDSVEIDSTPAVTWKLENVTANYASDAVETTFPAQHDQVNHDEIAQANVIDTAPSSATSVEPEASEIITTTTMPVVEPNANEVDLTTLPPTLVTSSSEAVTETSTISSTDPPVSTSTSEPTTIISSTTPALLEFIPFVEEDALNDTSSMMTSLNVDAPHDSSLSPEFNPEHIISLLKPLELKFMNGTEESLIAEGSREADPALEDALPIIVEKDVVEPFNPIPNVPYNISGTLPISTSLYNNGYYPHGNIIKDDGPPGELLVSEGELTPKEPEKMEDDEEELEGNPENSGFGVKFNLDSEDTDSVELNLPLTSSSPASPPDTTKHPEQPLQSISSIDTFIPSYSPATVQPVPVLDPIVPNSNPSRTYSKFGMQDSPFYRYDHHGLPPPSLDNTGFVRLPNVPPQQYHHRYYNEPEEIPQSRVQNPYNYYTHSSLDTADRQTNPQGQQQSVGMLPPLYKNTNFYYEDSSTGLESYEEYDTFPSPPSSNGLQSSTSPTIRYSSTSTPRSTTSYSHGSSIQFLGERVRLPSYNQQRATSTPKYKYAHKSTYQKKFTTERTTTPMSEYVKPIHPFPFNLPKNQDNLYNLGIKLSGCNVVGKMYSVGEIIEELSSDCLRCMCSDIGVHCAELKCTKKK